MENTILPSSWKLTVYLKKYNIQAVLKTLLLNQLDGTHFRPNQITVQVLVCTLNV